LPRDQSDQGTSKVISKQKKKKGGCHVKRKSEKNPEKTLTRSTSKGENKGTASTKGEKRKPEKNQRKEGSPFDPVDID